MKHFIYLFLLLIPFNHSLSHSHEVCAGYFPPNHLYIPVARTFSEENQSGLSEEEFHDAIDRVEKVYTPVFTELGKTLKVTREWENGTVNAKAKKNKDSLEIIMFGGMARHEFASFESFISVACHEIGHFIGGRPSLNFFNRDMTAEGQSDYYASSKCMRKLFTHQENLAYIES